MEKLSVQDDRASKGKSGLYKPRAVCVKIPFFFF